MGRESGMPVSHLPKPENKSPPLENRKLFEQDERASHLLLEFSHFGPFQGRIDVL